MNTDQFLFLNALWNSPGVVLLAAAELMTPVPLLAKTGQPYHDAKQSIICDDQRPQAVHVTLGRVTVINFPFKPKEVVPGGPGFDFKQIKNDLVIKSLRGGARTNLLVYLEDRRCAFNVQAVLGPGDDVLVIRDPKDAQMEVDFHE